MKYKMDIALPSATARNILTVLIWGTILFTISLRTALIHIILPYSAYIIVLMMLFLLSVVIAILLLSPQDIQVLRLHGSGIFLAVFGSYFLFVLFAMLNSIVAGTGYRKFGRIFGVFFLLVILLSLTWAYKSRKVGPEKALKYILRPYVYLSLYISITGILIWFLLTFGLIRASNWLFTLTEATKGIRLRESLYAFPFMLNLAEVNPGSTFFGYPLFRMCGFFEEPHQAGLFIMPCLFIIQYLYSDLSKKRQIYSFLIGSFLVLTFSPTVLSILYFCISLYFIRRFGIISIIPLVIGFFIFEKVFYMLQLYAPTYVEVRMSSYEKLLYSLRSVSLDTANFFGSGKLRPGGQVMVNILSSFGLGGFILLYFHYIIVFTLCLFFFFSKRKFSIMGLGPITVILHAHKGFHFDNPFYFYILYVTAAFLALTTVRRYKHGQVDNEFLQQGIEKQLQ